MAEQTISEVDAEIAAISEVYRALKGLDPGAQKRVMAYVAGKLGFEVSSDRSSDLPDTQDVSLPARGPQGHSKDNDDSSLDGISPVAKKWMLRNGLTASNLSPIFSVGEDEIDLIAKAVPGNSRKIKTRSVILLKALAAYLGSGAARITFPQIKEVSLHYDAYDSTNISKYLNDFAPEVSGNKESGYTLTARGIAAATDLVKALISPKTQAE